MTSKQKKFIELYEGNATQAAMAAGYSERTARSQGQRLLTNVDIQKAIKEREDKTNEVTIANRQQRQKFWSAIMENSTVEMGDRLKASELLAKSEGDFIKKVDLNFTHNLAERLNEARLRVQAYQANFNS